MNLPAVHLAAVYPDRIRILGSVLPPLRLGHVLLLMRIRNAAVTGGAFIDPASFATAVVVCGSSVAWAARQMARRKPSLAWRLRHAWVAWRARRAPEEFARFQKWFHEQLRMPEVESTERAGTPETSGTPFFARLLVVLGIGAEELPVGEALWRYVVHGELEGWWRVLPEEECRGGNPSVDALGAELEDLMARAEEMNRERAQAVSANN